MLAHAGPPAAPADPQDPAWRDVLLPKLAKVSGVGDKLRLVNKAFRTAASAQLTELPVDFSRKAAWFRLSGVDAASEILHVVRTGFPACRRLTMGMGGRVDAPDAAAAPDYGADVQAAAAAPDVQHLRVIGFHDLSFAAVQRLLQGLPSLQSLEFGYYAAWASADERAAERAFPAALEALTALTNLHVTAELLVPRGYRGYRAPLHMAPGLAQRLRVLRLVSEGDTRNTTEVLGILQRLAPLPAMTQLTTLGCDAYTDGMPFVMSLKPYLPSSLTSLELCDTTWGMEGGLPVTAHCDDDDLDGLQGLHRVLLEHRAAVTLAGQPKSALRSIEVASLVGDDDGPDDDCKGTWIGEHAESILGGVPSLRELLKSCGPVHVRRLELSIGAALPQLDVLSRLQVDALRFDGSWIYNKVEFQLPPGEPLLGPPLQRVLIPRAPPALVEGRLLQLLLPGATELELSGQPGMLGKWPARLRLPGALLISGEGVPQASPPEAGGGSGSDSDNSLGAWWRWVQGVLGSSWSSWSSRHAHALHSFALQHVQPPAVLLISTSNSNAEVEERQLAAAALGAGWRVRLLSTTYDAAVARLLTDAWTGKGLDGSPQHPANSPPARAQTLAIWKALGDNAVWPRGMASDMGG